MKTIWPLLRFLKPFAREVLLSIFLGVATIGSGIGLLGTSAYLIASAALHPSIAELQVAIVGVRFFGLSRAGFRYLERLVSHSVNLHVLAQIRIWFYERVVSAPPAEMLEQKSGDLLQRVLVDLETLENFYVRVVSPLIVAFVVALGASLFLGFYSPELPLLLLAGLELNGFILPALAVWAGRPLAQKLAQSRGELSVQTLEFIQGLEDLQANGADGDWLGRIQDKSSLAGQLQVKTAALGGLASGLSLLVLNLTVLAVLWVGIPMVEESQVSGVSLAVILLVTLASFESTAGMTQAATLLSQSLEAAKRIFGDLKNSLDPLQPLHDLKMIPEVNTVTLESVNFTYPGDHTFSVKDLTLKLEKGKRIGVIGPSGSGKTSLVNLFTRFWEIDSGTIHYNGFPAASAPKVTVRALISEIAQSTFLFSTSLRENLRMAKPDATEDELVGALNLAELSEWYQGLPEGLDTWLGDQGLRLSGGERQRVAIARAILQDRPFLILDEPVENLDAITARKLMTTLFTVFSDRGMVFISHDLKWMRGMDEIILMRDGTIIERGTHQELVNLEGRYAELVTLDDDWLN
jgi:ATP-binding cassette subfamily C protein CydC